MEWCVNVDADGTPAASNGQERTLLGQFALGTSDVRMLGCLDMSGDTCETVPGRGVEGHAVDLWTGHITDLLLMVIYIYAC